MGMRLQGIDTKTRLSLFFVLLTATIGSSARATELWVEPGPPRELRRCGDGVLYELDAPYGPLLLARIRGTHYEMGRQYGCLLGDIILDVVKSITGSEDSEDNSEFSDAYLYLYPAVWKRLDPYVPERYLDEIRGISEGAEEAG
ncbi:unnamed protein product, partial [marine sediment metagenome]